MKENHYLQSGNMQMFQAWVALFHLGYINISNTMGQHVLICLCNFLLSHWEVHGQGFRGSVCMWAHLLCIKQPQSAMPEQADSSVPSLLRSVFSSPVLTGMDFTRLFRLTPWAGVNNHLLVSIARAAWSWHWKCPCAFSVQLEINQRGWETGNRHLTELEMSFSWILLNGMRFSL